MVESRRDLNVSIYKCIINLNITYMHNIYLVKWAPPKLLFMPLFFSHSLSVLISVLCVFLLVFYFFSCCSLLVSCIQFCFVCFPVYVQPLVLFVYVIFIDTHHVPYCTHEIKIFLTLTLTTKDVIMQFLTHDLRDKYEKTLAGLNVLHLHRIKEWSTSDANTTSK